MNIRLIIEIIKHLPGQHDQQAHGRKSASDPSKEINNLIAGLKDWRGGTLKDIRTTVLSANSTIVEEWKWMGTPVWSSNSKLICLANPFKNKVKLTFPNGANLPDPDKLFNNGLKGKKWRTIDFNEGDRVKKSQLKKLIRAAIALQKD